MYQEIIIGDKSKSPRPEETEKYDYGVIEVTDFRNKTKTLYTICIRLGLVGKVCGSYHYTEVQFIYRDNDFQTQCLCLDRTSGNYSIKVIKKGDMSIEL